MNVLPSLSKYHNSKLFFSKNELTKILNCYSLGVSRGNWKDYAIDFTKGEANFYIFKHSLASPDCILTKKAKSNKNIFIYDLKTQNNKKSKFNKIDDLLVLLKRRSLHII